MSFTNHTVYPLEVYRRGYVHGHLQPSFSHFPVLAVLSEWLYFWVSSVLAFAQDQRARCLCTQRLRTVFGSRWNGFAS